MVSLLEILQTSTQLESNEFSPEEFTYKDKRFAFLPNFVQVLGKGTFVMRHWSYNTSKAAKQFTSLETTPKGRFSGELAVYAIIVLLFTHLTDRHYFSWGRSWNTQLSNTWEFILESYEKLHYCIYFINVSQSFWTSLFSQCNSTHTLQLGILQIRFSCSFCTQPSRFLSITKMSSMNRFKYLSQ